jgi:hypothetical protein
MTAATTVMCFMNETAKYSQELEIPGVFVLLIIN